MTGNYDADTNTVYWGVGNASTLAWRGPSGDNLYTSSCWDSDPEKPARSRPPPVSPERFLGLDEVEAPMLVDLQKDGHTIRA